MSVRIKNYVPDVTSDKRSAASVFLRLMTDRINAYSDPNTPKREGYLRRGVVKQVLGLSAKISWLTVYAAVQERGSRADGSHKIQHYTTPGTGKHFAENAVKKAVAESGAVFTAARLF